MKIREKIFVEILLLCVVFFSGRISSAATTVVPDAAMSGFQLSEEPVSARNIALGNSGTAINNGGFGYYNPASPLLNDRGDISFEYGGYPKADMTQNHLEAVFPISKWCLATSFRRITVEGFYPVESTGQLPDFLHPASWQFTQVSLGVSYRHANWWGIGIAFNGLHEQLFDMYSYAFSGSVGLLFLPIPSRLSVGAAVTGIRITSLPMSTDDSTGSWGAGERIPLNARIGAGWNDTLPMVSLPYRLTADIVLRNVYDRSHSIRYGIRNRITVPCGLEVSVLPMLCLRVGKRFNMETELLTCGMGFSYQALSADVSFVLPRLAGDTELKWQTMVTYSPRGK